MRSNRDLDSKTPRHNRQGFTPREPPQPLPSTSVKTITESRGAAGGEGPSLGTVPLHHVLRLASPSLTPSSCLLRWASNLWKVLEGELRGMLGQCLDKLLGIF